ncbi:MAG: sodium:solute symporter family protein [Deltaproteobacteria bacterium]|nr:sodium:solute symporter family protein [Deltaproteobacteria bacterium]
MNAYAIGLLISILVYLIVGSYAGRKVKHLDDYFVAGRSAPTLLIVGTLVASFLSTNAFLGETGFSYQGHGPQILILTSINAMGYVIGALFFGRFLRRSECLTVAEYFGRRFESQGARVQIAAGLTIIIGLSAYLLAVTQGASLIVSEVTDIPYAVSLFVVWAGYAAFTLYSGSRGVIITDTIMFLLFTVVAFVSLYFIIASTGGWFATIEALSRFESKPGLISWHGYIGPESLWETPIESLTWAVLMGVSWGLVVAVSPWQSSRYLMAKDEHTVIRSACIAVASILAVYIALVFGATAVNLVNPGIEVSERVMIWAAVNLMPTLPAVLLMTGIMAAALSSASTFLSLVSFSACHDIFPHHTEDDRRHLRVSRYTMFAVGVVILGLAFFQPPAILWITYFAGTLFASSWGPLAFFSVWSDRITAAGAFWGIVTGFLGNAVAKLLATFEVIDLPVFLDPFVIGISLSAVTILLVSKMGRVTDGERSYRAMLHQIPSGEVGGARARQTLQISKMLMATGALMILAMVICYARPYASGQGAAPLEDSTPETGSDDYER